MNLVSLVLTTVIVLMCLYLLFIWYCFGFYVDNRQKTRNPQQRRMYVGSRSRPSSALQEPSIYVSPANLPPPPKYEAMAPPSYEEVVGIHYPNYQTTQVQPITQPISQALAHSSTENNTSVPVTVPTTVITVTPDSRPTVVS